MSHAFFDEMMEKSSWRSASNCGGAAALDGFEEDAA